MNSNVELYLLRMLGEDVDLPDPSSRIEELLHQLCEKESDPTTNLEAHVRDVSNPHSVTAEQVGAATTKSFMVTLDSAGWSGDKSPYKQSISVPGILASDNPFVDVVPTDDESTIEYDAWALVIRIATEQDGITVYASDVPSVNIKIQVKVVR